MLVFNLTGLPVTQVPLGLNEKGLPLGVQVAARVGNDHLTIAVALELERVFGGWTPPPLSSTS
jgi:fatty acid amide hydrolase 2